MKKYFLLLAASAATLICGCTRYSYGTVSLEHASTKGTPVALRMSASDSGTYFLGLGSDPSLKLAIDELYAVARNAGYRMNGNNYAFQNLLVEKEYSPLYPILGSVTLTVCGDLYAYKNNCGAKDAVHEKNSDRPIEVFQVVKPDLVQIPAGTFMMGSPGGEEGRDDDETHVRVRISEPFYLGKTEVTQAQWKAVMGSNPSYFKGDNLPVECVSWDEAMEFCRKLTEREHSAGRLLRGWKYTLPTEAQWEYACRAGTTTAYYTGGSSGDLARAGWYDANSGTQTHPVGQKMPNAFGLYDMHGNVWEWCLDWYGSRLQGGDNPMGPKSGSDRVLRGGSWHHSARNCRSARRYNYSPSVRDDYLGFRVALVRE